MSDSTGLADIGEDTRPGIGDAGVRNLDEAVLRILETGRGMSTQRTQGVAQTPTWGFSPPAVTVPLSLSLEQEGDLLGHVSAWRQFELQMEKITRRDVRRSTLRASTANTGLASVYAAQPLPPREPGIERHSSRYESAARLLEAWLQEDDGYDEEVWPSIEASLNIDGIRFSEDVE